MIPVKSLLRDMMLPTRMLGRTLFRTMSESPPFHVSMMLQRNPVILPPWTPLAAAYRSFLEHSHQAEVSRGTFMIADETKGTHSLSASSNKESTNALASSSSSSSAAAIPSTVSYAATDSNTRSLNRLLSRKLFLVLQRRADSQWEFPTRPYDTTGLAVHEAASCALRLICGEQFEFYAAGSCPIAFHATMDKKTIFFFLSQIMPPKPAPLASAILSNPNSDYTDYAWLCKEELATRLPPTYFQAIQASLMD